MPPFKTSPQTLGWGSIQEGRFRLVHWMQTAHRHPTKFAEQYLVWDSKFLRLASVAPADSKSRTLAVLVVQYYGPHNFMWIGAEAYELLDILLISPYQTHVLCSIPCSFWEGQIMTCPPFSLKIPFSSFWPDYYICKPILSTSTNSLPSLCI